MDDSDFSSWFILVPNLTFLRSRIKVHSAKENCAQVQQSEIFAPNSSPVGSGILVLQNISFGASLRATTSFGGRRFFGALPKLLGGGSLTKWIERS